MSSWTLVEESLPFDADIRFGNTAVADILGSGSLRYFTFDGRTKIALVNIGLGTASTGVLAGGISFFNRNVVAADKRISGINCIVGAAINSGELAFYSANAGVFNILLQLKPNTDSAIGIGSIATGATAGHLYIPSCAGTPTGAPTGITGFIPLVYDRTNNILYAYSNAAWRAH